MQFQGGPDFEWFADSKAFSYQADERGETSIEVRTWTRKQASKRSLIHEHAEHYVDPGETFIRLLHDSGEFVWSSERDGWNHLYLYNQKTGALKNQITQGPWVVRQILDVDEKSANLFSGQRPRERRRPLSDASYTLGLDGKNLTLLTPENATHTVSISPDHALFGRQLLTPGSSGRSVLRNLKDGSQVRVLEQSDATEIQHAGWKYPEPFQGKATDGTTDLYGLIWRPSNFDPTKNIPSSRWFTPARKAFSFPNFGQLCGPPASDRRTGFHHGDG